jgi:ferredoxin--NADP+ reductase
MAFTPNGRVTALIRVHPGLVRLRVRLDGRPLDWQAGQYTFLGLHGERRPYSISSPLLAPDGHSLPAGGNPELEFYLRTDDGTMGAALGALQSGDSLEVGPEVAGRCTLGDVPQDADVLLCATGTGEAPHNAIITALLRRGQKGRIGAVVSCRLEEDLAYRDIHRRLAGQYEDYAYLGFATREGAHAGRHIQDLLQDGTLARITGVRLKSGPVHVFLCGNSAMVGRPERQDGRWIYPPGPGLTELLVKHHGLRLPEQDDPGNIHFERYD